MAKCRFKEWLYGPKNKWPEEPPKAKQKNLDEHRKRAGSTVESPIVVSDEGDEEEDDTARLSELIALAEAGLQAKETEDDTGRLRTTLAD